MCLSPKAPKVEPVAPIAPLAPPAPMALADAASTRKEDGVAQLRIAGRRGIPAVMGTGAAANAALTLQGRKSKVDEAIAAAGG